MKKEEVRREFFKLKNKGFSYETCKRLLQSTEEYSVSTRTLKRWINRFDEGIWDLKDRSRKPKKMHYKITSSVIEEVIRLRKKTGWGHQKLYPYLTHLGISEMSIKRILKKNGLCRETKTKGKRVKWVRWQRKNPNSLWQMDHSDDMNEDGYTLSVLDDCSRYSLALVKLNRVTTDVVTQILDDLIKKHGKPKQILTDNGSVYGLKSQHSKFDRWCKHRGINHIRTKVHSPTTNGKVERLFKTIDQEIAYCNNDQELFRLRYNHYRSHSSLNGKTPAQIYFGS